MNVLNKALSWRWAPLIPPLALAACLWLWAVDVLNWDEWLIWSDALRKLHAGAFGPADIILQNNEQRSAIVRVLGLTFFPWFRLARWPELASIFLMAAASGLLAWRLLRRSGWPAGDRRPLVLFSLLSFSLMQWETFTVGINTSIILPTLTIWAGANLATGGRALGPGRFCALAVLGLPASFSFANGLFYWPCMAPLIALRAGEGEDGGGRSQAVKAVGLWLAIGALAWVGYFANYEKPAHHPSLLLALRRPHQLLGYFTSYLGGALVVDGNLQSLALLAGVFALVALTTLARALWLGGTESRRVLAPWLCVAGFTLLTAGATATARGGFGLTQAVSSRYATFSSPIWMVIGALAFLGRDSLSDGTRCWLSRGFALCASLFVLSTVLCVVVLHNRAPRLERARHELYRLTEPENLREIFPDPAFVMAQTPLFTAMRAGAQRFLPPDAALREGPDAPGEVSILPLSELDGRVPGYLLCGNTSGGVWTWLVIRVASSGDDRVVGLGKVETDGSFALFLPENALPTGRRTLLAAVLDRDGRTLHAIDPDATLAVDNQGRNVANFDLAGHFFVPGLTEPARQAHFF